MINWGGGRSLPSQPLLRQSCRSCFALEASQSPPAIGECCRGANHPLAYTVRLTHLCCVIVITVVTSTIIILLIAACPYLSLSLPPSSFHHHN
eukprot:scaffold191383_cov41-Prasinocladus_malaysianus.AAC.3